MYSGHNRNGYNITLLFFPMNVTLPCIYIHQYRGFFLAKFVVVDVKTPEFDGPICSAFALSLDANYRNCFSFKRYRFFSYFQYMKLQFLHNSNITKSRNNKFFSNIYCIGRPLCVLSKYYLTPLCFV